MNQRKRRWHGYVLGLSAIAWAVLVDLARSYFVETIDVSSVIGLIVFGVIAALGLYWLVSNVPEWWQRFLDWLRRWWDPPATVPPQTELGSYAEQAQGFLVALGSDSGGMAAAEWFERAEPALRKLVESSARPESVDELAWICDALEAGYVRQRRAGALLERAHALELTGVAAWLQDNRRQAVLWWQESRRRYADVDEREGEARCLQHLGAAALLSGDAVTAGELLERSAQLRGGVHGHEVLARYLSLVRTRLGQGTDPAPEHVTRPNRIGPVERIRLLFRRLRSSSHASRHPRR